MLTTCHRCGREFALPAGFMTEYDSLSIKANYCPTCATATNARFLSIYGGK